MLFSREELLLNSLAAGSKCFLKGVGCCGKTDKYLTLLHSERPKIVYNFGLSECNTALRKTKIIQFCTQKDQKLYAILAFLSAILHSERPKLYTILAFLSAIGLRSDLSCIHSVHLNHTPYKVLCITVELQWLEHLW